MVVSLLIFRDFRNVSRRSGGKFTDERFTDEGLKVTSRGVGKVGNELVGYTPN